MSASTLEHDAIAVSGLVQRRRIPIPHTARGPVYAHMGGLLSDVILQPGLRYSTVVAPRVRLIIERYAEAHTTTRFLKVLNAEGPMAVLMWAHDEKPRRLLALTSVMAASAVETVDELAEWLTMEENCCQLIEIRGIGPKSLDYLRRLAGADALAVDRHIRAFAADAGVTDDRYGYVREVFERAAALLSARLADLDHAIWRYQAAQR
jgi:hypothetical protein